MVNDTDDEAQSDLAADDSDLGDNADWDLEHIEAYIDSKQKHTKSNNDNAEEDDSDEYIKEGLGILSDNMDWDCQS